MTAETVQTARDLRDRLYTACETARDRESYMQASAMYYDAARLVLALEAEPC